MSESSDLGIIGGEVTEIELDKVYAEAEQRRLFEEQESIHNRNQRTRYNLHWALLVVFWVGIVFSLGFVFVWIWHILAPEDLYFVTDAKLDIIQAVLVSIVGSSSFTAYAKNWLKKHAD